MKNNPFAAVPPAIWALFAVLIALAAMGGYTFGYTTAGNAAREATPESTTVPAEASDAADTPATPSELTGTPAAPGKASIAAVTDPAVIDPMLVGGSGDVTSEKDMLNIHRRNPKDPFAIGAIDAPVVISEFSDLECPFCARHTNETAPRIFKKYVEKGLVRIEWNDLPINGPHAVAAAKAGRAAAAQGKFHEFTTELYARSADIPGHPNNDIDDFVDIAATVGVPDLERFRTEATDGTYDEVVTTARDYATNLGLTGTPGFIVGEQFVSGAQPYEVFDKTIQQELIRAHRRA